MVFFVCSSCQDTLKLRALEAHRCGVSVSCVDCSADFAPAEARFHNKCISEAQKYEKSLHRPSAKATKPSPQDLWTAAATAAADACKDSRQQALFQRLADYPNMPRTLSKFAKFALNSLRVRDDALVTAVFKQIDAVFRSKGAASEDAAGAPAPAVVAGTKRRRDDGPATEADEGAPIKVKSIVKRALVAAHDVGIEEEALVHDCVKQLLRSGSERASNEREAADIVRARLVSMKLAGKVQTGADGTLKWA